MERGEVRWGDGEIVTWIPEDVIVPASDRLVAYLSSRSYQEPCNEAARSARARGLVVAKAPSR